MKQMDFEERGSGEKREKKANQSDSFIFDPMVLFGITKFYYSEKEK
jgi:hypothetical protein